MIRLINLLGTAYFLYKIGSYLLDEIDLMKFEEWFDQFDKEDIRREFAKIEYEEWSKVKKDLGYEIDQRFNELHATPEYWEHVKETTHDE